jgi:hypothetical protein
LLGGLGEACAELRYHGRLKWPDVTIANGIIGHFGDRPWHLDAGAYRRGAEAGGATACSN